MTNAHSLKKIYSTDILWGLNLNKLEYIKNKQ